MPTCLSRLIDRVLCCETGQAIPSTVVGNPSPQPTKTYRRNDHLLRYKAPTLGAFLLALSLLEAGKGNALLAEGLHRNAEELTALTKRIDLRVSAHDAGRLLTEADLAGYNEEYESIKARCVTNHAPKDYLLFIGEKRMAPEFAKNDGTPAVNGWQYRWRHTWWLLSSVWHFLLLWLTIAYLCYENWAQYPR